MKYSNEIVIDVSVDEIIAIFEDPENLKYWQPDIKSFTHVKGEIGQPGAVTKLRVDMVIREIEMTETIISRNVPDAIVLKYESDGVMNQVTNRFEVLAPNKTKWVMENHFTFSGFMKLAAGPLKPIFRKKTHDTMQQLKKFAENR